MADEEKVTVIDDAARNEEAESLCKWAAGRAGAEQMAMLEGTSVVTYPIQKFLLP